MYHHKLGEGRQEGMRPIGYKMTLCMSQCLHLSLLKLISLFLRGKKESFISASSSLNKPGNWETKSPEVLMFVCNQVAKSHEISRFVCVQKRCKAIL